jgi:hypothetical protein
MVVVIIRQGIEGVAAIDGASPLNAPERATLADTCLP